MVINLRYYRGLVDVFRVSLIERWSVSYAEKNIAREYTDHDLETHYRDGRLVAKRWINRVHYGADVDWSLKSLTSWIGFSCPRHLGDGKATKKIRYVHGMLERKGKYERLTGTAKRHWTNLLTYNKLDCMSLRDLVLRAASELDLAVEHRISG